MIRLAARRSRQPTPRTAGQSRVVMAAGLATGRALHGTRKAIEARRWKTGRRQRSTTAAGVIRTAYVRPDERDTQVRRERPPSGRGVGRRRGQRSGGRSRAACLTALLRRLHELEHGRHGAPPIIIQRSSDGQRLRRIEDREWTRTFGARQEWIASEGGGTVLPRLRSPSAFLPLISQSVES